MVDRIDKNISGVEITDELHTDVGSGVFELDHDTIMDNSTLDVWTGANKTGTQLTQGTDYVLDTKITNLSDEAGVDVYRYIEVINFTYETGDLYFSYDTVGDFVEAEDINLALNHIDNTSDPHNIQASQTDFDDTSFFTTAPDVATALNALSSAGVVDEGSTADGDYIRYENGWQICVYEPILDYDEGSRLTGTWSFPQSFNLLPKVLISPIFDTTNIGPNDNEISTIKADSISTTDVNFLGFHRITGGTDFVSGDEITAAIMAIGRWK